MELCAITQPKYQDVLPEEVTVGALAALLPMYHPVLVAVFQSSIVIQVSGIPKLLLACATEEAPVPPYIMGVISVVAEFNDFNSLSILSQFGFIAVMSAGSVNSGLTKP